mmetsp:Transcript_62421/g.147166  ORF Transcript_62421/g.147166 Transcript_62421/m.147166 type:complete len:612 (-) Transcript_62421:399-2234(-)
MRQQRELVGEDDARDKVRNVLVALGGAEQRDDRLLLRVRRVQDGGDVVELDELAVRLARVERGPGRGIELLLHVLGPARHDARELEHHARTHLRFDKDACRVAVDAEGLSERDDVGQEEFLHRVGEVGAEAGAAVHPRLQPEKVQGLSLHAKCLSLKGLGLLGVHRHRHLRVLQRRRRRLERKSGVESARARVLKVLGGLGEQNEGVLFERYVGQPDALLVLAVGRGVEEGVALAAHMQERLQLVARHAMPLLLEEGVDERGAARGRQAPALELMKPVLETSRVEELLKLDHEDAHLLLEGPAVVAVLGLVPDTLRRHQVLRPSAAMQLVLEVVLDVVLHVLRDVAPMGDVSDARQRYGGSVGGGVGGEEGADLADDVGVGGRERHPVQSLVDVAGEVGVVVRAIVPPVLEALDLVRAEEVEVDGDAGQVVGARVLHLEPSFASGVLFVEKIPHKLEFLPPGSMLLVLLRYVLPELVKSGHTLHIDSMTHIHAPSSSSAAAAAAALAQPLLLLAPVLCHVPARVRAVCALPLEVRMVAVAAEARAPVRAAAVDVIARPVQRVAGSRQRLALLLLGRRDRRVGLLCGRGRRFGVERELLESDSILVHLVRPR